MAFGEREPEDKDNGEEVKLEWKDYVAFVIALFQTARAHSVDDVWCISFVYCPHTDSIT